MGSVGGDVAGMDVGLTDALPVADLFALAEAVSLSVSLTFALAETVADAELLLIGRLSLIVNGRSIVSTVSAIEKSSLISFEVESVVLSPDNAFD